MTVFTKIRVIIAFVFLILIGCSRQLPFPGPYGGYIVDSATGKPVAGAAVEAEWWCHDSPIPDGSGSYFIRVSTVCDGKGIFSIKKETRRGGYFGSSFALKIKAKGYIPATLIGEKSNIPLPPSTAAYPFIDTSQLKSFPPELIVKLKPAGPVYIELLKSEDTFFRRKAAEELQKLLGVDHGYDAARWKEALRYTERKGWGAERKAPL